MPRVATQDRLPLTTAILNAHYMKPLARGVLTITSTDGVTAHYSKRELDALHSELHGWLTRDWNRHPQVRNAVYPDTKLAEHARCYLHWIQQPDAPLVPSTGRWLAGILDVNVATVAEGLLKLDVLQYKRGQDAADTPQVWYVRDQQPLPLTLEEMTTVWPGSDERLHRALALGLPMTDLVTYVFENPVYLQPAVEPAALPPQLVQVEP